jgi:hypothetical protein
MRTFKSQFKLVFALLLIILGCKKDEPQNYIATTQWIKINTLAVSSSILDTKLYPNGNIGFLEQNYYLIDSNGNLLQSYNLPQSSVYKSQRIANQTYINFSGSIVVGTPKYYLFSYDYSDQGYIKQQGVIDPKYFVPIKDDEYATILDDKIDKPTDKKPIRLFYANIRDSIQNNRYWVTKRDLNLNREDSKYFELPGPYTNFLTTNSAYLFYSIFDAKIIVFDKNFNPTGTSLRTYTPSCIKASDDAFYIQYSDKLYKTIYGNDYSLIADKFSLHEIVNDTTLVGLSNKEPALFDLKNNNITIIGKNGLPGDFSRYTDMCKITAIGNKLFWFSPFGTYMYKLK